MDNVTDSCFNNFLDAINALCCANNSDIFPWSFADPVSFFCAAFKLVFTIFNCESIAAILLNKLFAPPVAILSNAGANCLTCSNDAWIFSFVPSRLIGLIGLFFN